MNKLLLYDESTLNIFCDASISKFQDLNITIGCAGVVIVSNNNNRKLNFLYDNYNVIYETTNNNSEITAILLGIIEAIKNKDKFNVINLFSDSKICIYGLREWIFNWICNIKNGIMISSSLLPVANQNIISKIINYIVYNNLSINLYHQKGHVANTNNSLNNASKVFYESNNIILTQNEIIDISYYNNMVDIRTKDILLSLDRLYREKSLLQPIEFPITGCDMNLYKNLINIERRD